ncbi:unnamed protein product [Leptidea sinapis]|uniref:Uncharacterized protein n=1 Tax=Leptidea sinapis TaxID=189913 RepID=A0A5E4QMX6_9NEOP|nr:unnamed protein product [Leptidea sinapis]
MKFVIVLSALVAVAFCAPHVAKTEQELDEQKIRRRLPALEHEEIHDEFGQYALRYVTAEGTVVSETGRLVPAINEDGEETYVLVVEGEVSYIGDDGELYVTKYSAGLNGTEMSGNHLPVPVKPETTPRPTESS